MFIYINIYSYIKNYLPGILTDNTIIFYRAYILLLSFVCNRQEYLKI